MMLYEKAKKKTTNSFPNSPPIQRAPVKYTNPGVTNIAHLPNHISRTTTTITKTGVIPLDFHEGDSMEIKGLYKYNKYESRDPSEATRQVSRAASEAVGLTGRSCAYIAGHLLNQKLGGDGHDQRNITAFSRSSNAKHNSEIEEQVKEEIENDNIVLYEVNITQRNHNVTSPGITVTGMASEMTAQYSLLDDSLAAVPDPSIKAHYKLKRKVDFTLTRGSESATPTDYP